MGAEAKGGEVEKSAFLKMVAGVMKGMISNEGMMVSLQRSCLRSESENLDLMGSQEEKVDALIEGMETIEQLDIPNDAMDALVLRYLRNMDFLAHLEEQCIDVSTIGEGDLAFWKKTMLFKKISCKEPSHE